MPQELEMVFGHGELREGSPADRLDVGHVSATTTPSGQVPAAARDRGCMTRLSSHPVLPAWPGIGALDARRRAERHRAAPGVLAGMNVIDPRELSGGGARRRRS